MIEEEEANGDEADGDVPLVDGCAIDTEIAAGEEQHRSAVGKRTGAQQRPVVCADKGVGKGDDERENGAGRRVRDEKLARIVGEEDGVGTRWDGRKDDTRAVERWE
mgnify:CR=1 FL=1